MGVESRYFADCERCGEVEEIDWPEYGPDGEILTPADWRSLCGIAVEEIGIEPGSDLCSSCVEELEAWVKNGP